MSKLRDLAGRLGADRAVAYAVAMRAWQVPSGVVTMLLIVFSFDLQTRGVYGTMVSLIGLQALADSGLLNVIMHAVSHEWADLRLDKNGFLRGSRTTRGRVAAILRFGLIWFLACAVALVVVGIAIGAVLFSGQDVDRSVIYPLTIAMCLAGSSLALAPLVATLEGCNQVAEVNRYRWMQAITGSVVVWSCLVGGANLWTPVGAVLVQLGWECVLLFGRYRALVFQLWKTPSSSFHWKTEIWPLQWRIGAQSAMKYLAIFPMVPTLFAWQGPEIAGRAWMTWSVLGSLQLISYAWIRTRAPEFGRLIASGQRHESNLALFKAIRGSTLLLVATVSSFWIALFVLHKSSFEIAYGGHRVTSEYIANGFLPLHVTAWFAAALIPLHLGQCFAIHLRSRKIDPIWRITIVGNSLLAIAVFWSARQHGAQAIGIAMLLTYSVMMPVIFLVWRKYDRHYAASEAT